MLPWNERLHGVGAQVIMKLVHMHEGLVRFPDHLTLNCRVDRRLRLIVSKDRLNDEILLIVMSYSQRIDADGIVAERAKVVDM